MEATQQYRIIPAEPWGRRLARVRDDVAGLTLAEAAEHAARYMATTDATISRLESLSSEPIGPRQQSRRQLAYVLCLLYGVDPAEFGLRQADVPEAVRNVIPIGRDLAVTASRCNPYRLWRHVVWDMDDVA